MAKISITCAQCGKTFMKHSCYVNRRQNEKHFCSNVCYNTSRKNNQPHTPKNYRKKAMESMDSVCSVCGWSDIPDILDVHHIDEDRENNTLDNLIVLCPTHHAMVTRGYALISKDKTYTVLTKKKHIIKNLPKQYLESLMPKIHDLVACSDCELEAYGFYAKMSRRWGCSFVTARQIIIRYKNGDYVDLIKTF